MYTVSIKAAVVEQALRQVRNVFPDVVQVFFGVAGNWLFLTDTLDAPEFSYAHGIDTDLLECARNAAAEDKGLPCVYCIGVDFA